MIETILFLSTAVVLLLLAQWGESRASLRWIVLGLLFVIGYAVLAAGIAVWMKVPWFTTIVDASATRVFQTMVILTGLSIVAPTGLAMTMTRQGRAPVIRNIPWTDPVFLTSWTFFALFIGSNFALHSSITPDSLKLNDPLLLLLIQDSFLVVLVLLGVGWGTRRGWRETAQRLGISRFGIPELLAGAGTELLMLFATVMIAGALTLFFGESMTSAAAFNQDILSKLPGVGGILLLGLATGVGEEVLYRGALQPVLGIWLTSFLFAVSHIQYLNPALLVIFVLGLILGYSREKWGLLTAIWTHALYNSIVAIIALYATQIS